MTPAVTGTFSAAAAAAKTPAATAATPIDARNVPRVRVLSIGSTDPSRKRPKPHDKRRGGPRRGGRQKVVPRRVRAFDTKSCRPVLPPPVAQIVESASPYPRRPSEGSALCGLASAPNFQNVPQRYHFRNHMRSTQG